MISNNYFLSNEGHIKEYINGVQGRWFENGASTAWAIPTLTHSQAPTAPACTYGCVDYGTVDQPTVRLYVNPERLYASVQLYSSQDIGTNSPMRIDVIAFTYSS